MGKTIIKTKSLDSEVAQIFQDTGLIKFSKKECRIPEHDGYELDGDIIEVPKRKFKKKLSFDKGSKE